MTRLILTAFSFFGVLGLAVSAQAQTTVKLQQGTSGYSGCMDTYIDKFMPNDFYGGVERIEIRDWDGGVTEKMNFMIKFDLSGLSLPSNATITGAKLTLYSIRARGQSGDVPVLETCTSAWNNQWTWAMGLPSVSASGVTCPPVAATYTDDPTTPEPYAITGLQSLVQAWMATPLNNYGIMMSVTSNLNFRFASSENPTTTARPELEITYTTPAPANPPTVTATPPTPPLDSPITVTGTAAATAPATVTQVKWKNNLTGASGTATGTTSWSASIPLGYGSNSITITVTDSTGATGTTSFTVSYLPPKVAGKADHHMCGMGVAESPTDTLVVAGIFLVLMLAATYPGRRAAK